MSTNTRNASDTTWLRKVRTIYADRVIQQAQFDTGLKNHIVFEGNGSQKLLSYVPIYNVLSGETQTTPEELQIYIESVTSLITKVPDVPTNLSATTTLSTSVVIAFASPSSDGGSPITNYKYSIDGGISYTALSPAYIASPITISGLSPSTTYSIMLRAVNGVGDGAESASLSVTTISAGSAPNPPNLQYALPDTGSAWVYFVAGSNGGSALTNYQYSLDGTTFTDLSPASTSNPVKITGLTNGTSYTITLKAKNSAGESTDSNTVTATPVVTSIPSALLYYDPSNSSSYSGSGTTINNIGSYGALSGTFPGASVTYDGTIANGILNFNGAFNAMITFPSFDFGTLFSVTAWIYPLQKYSINGLLTNAAANVPTNGFKFQWHWWNSESKVIGMQAGNGTIGGDNYTLVDTITYNVWQHVAYVFDKTNRRIIFFLNGEPAAMSSPISNVNANDAPVPNIKTNGAFYVGGYSGGSYTMKARLGYIKTFNSFLDATQVRADYLASASRFA